MLNINPNAYFYRHVAPGETQKMGEWFQATVAERISGEWSQEEYDLFIEVARRYGCGDKV